jgi:hypothetical protein
MLDVNEASEGFDLLSLKWTFLIVKEMAPDSMVTLKNAWNLSLKVYFYEKLR